MIIIVVLMHAYNIQHPLACFITLFLFYLPSHMPRRLTWSASVLLTLPRLNSPHSTSSHLTSPKTPAAEAANSAPFLHLMCRLLCMDISYLMSFLFFLFCFFFNRHTRTHMLAYLLAHSLKCT